MRGGNQLPSPEGAAARSPQEHEQGTERGWERSRPTQLLEPWEHVHHEEAVVRLALHHGVQPQVHVQEPRQGVEPEDLCQRGDAVVVEVEALQRRQALNALLQISQEAGQVVWYAHLCQNFQQFVVIHTVKGLGIVNKAEIHVFLELSCFFNNPADAGNLISGSSVFSKSSSNIWTFTVHVLLKPGLENFEHYFTSVLDECNCAVV